MINIDKLLYPELDRIPRLPIDVWCFRLQNLMDRIMKNIRVSDDLNPVMNDLLVLTNQVSLLCFYLCKEDKAKTICENALCFFYEYYNSSKNSKDQYGIIQPWINLIRLDRFTGKNTSALIKLRLFNPFSLDGTINIHNFTIQCIKLSKSTINLIKFCFVDESIKSFINLKDYSSLNEFILLLDNEQRMQSLPKELIEEAKAVHLFHADPHNVVNYIESLLQRVRREFRDIFSLKLIQTHIALGELHKARLLIQPLFKKYLLAIQFVQLPQLRFCINLASTLLFLDMKIEAKQLIKLIIEKLDIYNDELGRLECLALVKDEDDFKSIWNHSLDVTHYMRFQCRFVNSVIPGHSEKVLNDLILLSDQLLGFLKGERVPTDLA